MEQSLKVNITCSLGATLNYLQYTPSTGYGFKSRSNGGKGTSTSGLLQCTCTLCSIKCGSITGAKFKGLKHCLLT